MKTVGSREQRRARRAKQREIADKAIGYRENAKPPDPFPPPPSPQPQAFYKDIKCDGKNISFKYKLRGTWFWKTYDGHYNNTKVRAPDELKADVRRVLTDIVSVAELAARKGAV